MEKRKIWMLPVAPDMTVDCPLAGRAHASGCWMPCGEEDTAAKCGHLIAVDVRDGEMVVLCAVEEEAPQIPSKP